MLISAQCPEQDPDGYNSIIYGSRMHGQIFTCRSVSLGDFGASNDHKVTFQHGLGPIQTTYTGLANIPGFGLLNGAFRYNFTPNSFGIDILKFTFSDNTDPLEGVNVWDLSLISRHILGLQSFTNPYQMLAADVSIAPMPPYGITTYDIVQLRKLILGTYTSFGQIDSRVNSWRFVPLNRFYNNSTGLANFVINPFNVTLGESYPNYLNQVSFGAQTSPFLYDHLFRASAVAVKMGDVNFEAGAFACETLTGTVDDRTVINQNETGVSSSEIIAAGTPVSIKLKSTAFSDIASWQAGIKYNSEKLKITGINSSTFEQLNENAYRIESSAIRIVWLHDQAKLTNIEEGAVFLEIKGETLTPVNKDELLINFNHEILPFLVFDAQGNLVPVHFNYEISVAEKQETTSIFPNPFNDHFSLCIPKETDDTEASIQLTSIEGVSILKQPIVFLNGIAYISTIETTLPNGIYIAIVNMKNGNTYRFELIKQ